MRNGRTFVERIQDISTESISYIEESVKYILKGKEDTHCLKLLDNAIFNEPYNEMCENRIEYAYIGETGDVVLMDDDGYKYVCYAQDFCPEVYAQVGDAISCERYRIEEL
jgi:hypothetical protein